jgi:ArsR family transcriptional regulator
MAFRQFPFDIRNRLAILPSMQANAKTRKVAAARAEIIKALAHPSRILIADALAGGELCVCELTELVGADISTVSKHLTVMRQAGLLESEKRGPNQYYSLRCPCLADFFRCIDSIQQSKAKALVRCCI